MSKLNGKQEVANNVWKFWEITDNGRKLKTRIEQDGNILEESIVDALGGESFDPTNVKHFEPYSLDDNGNYDETGNNTDPTLGLLSVDADPDNDYGVEWVDITVRLSDREIVDIDTVVGNKYHKENPSAHAYEEMIMFQGILIEENNPLNDDKIRQFENMIARQEQKVVDREVYFKKTGKWKQERKWKSYINGRLLTQKEKQQGAEAIRLLASNEAWLNNKQHKGITNE